MLIDRVFGPLGVLGLIFLRVALGWVFIAHGYAKLFTDKPGVKRFSSRLESLCVPFPVFFAVAAGVSEFFGGIALILGIATRWAALFLTIDMAVALQKVAYQRGFTRGAEEVGYEYCVVLLACTLALLVMGPGPVSLDWLLGIG